MMVKMENNLLKNLYNQEYIEKLSTALQSSHQRFEKEKFINSIFDTSWQDLELKERMRHIAITMQKFLPNNYTKAIEILKITFLKIGAGLTLENMIFQDYVQVYGLDEFDTSIQALEYFTIESSSEFAIRHFIIRYPKQTMRQMKEWSKHKNHHVRRLASEGCRPRLPWAIFLHEFKEEPSLVLEILENLKDDESEYVRKSVANNLNDISKDNPEIVIQIAKEWIGENINRDKIIKHGCRTLLKNSNKDVLNIFGFNEPNNIKIENLKFTDKVNLGEELSFSFDINSNKNLGKLRIEYAINFLRQNNKFSRKVFKISEGIFNQKQKFVEKKYSFKQITTRKYYQGIHALTIIINGKEFSTTTFSLN